MRKLLLVLVLTTLSLLGASFDCSKAKSDVEKMICQDDELSKLDEKLNEVYARFYLLTPEIKTDQRAWMKKRNACQDDFCIKEAYITRFEELNTSLSNQNTFPKYLLDTMKTTENKNMELFVKTLNHSDKFKNKLFRFQNIQRKKPLIEGAQYSNAQLKQILGQCYNYKLYIDFKWIYTVIAPQYIKTEYVLSDNPEYFKDKWRFSVWSVNAHNKEWFFINRFSDNNEEYRDLFLIEKDACEDKKYSFDLMQDINSNKLGYEKHHGEIMIVDVENKDYIFESIWFDSITFDLKEINKGEHNSLYNTHESITFTKIKQPGEK